MESSNQTTGAQDYPVRFSVEYPDRELNRLTTAFRLIVAIPILILAGTIDGHEGAYGGGHGLRICSQMRSSAWLYWQASMWACTCWTVVSVSTSV